MLTCEVKIDAQGLGINVEKIATIHIVNMGPPEKGNYDDFPKERIYHAWTDYTGELPDHKKEPDAIVSHYRNDGAFTLLQKVIGAIRKRDDFANRK